MQRLEKLSPETAPEGAKPILAELGAKGPLKNIFLAMANSPSAFEGYLAMSRALGKGTLGNKSREAIALFLAHRNQCDYCNAAHTFLAKQLRYEDSQISAFRRGEAAGDAKVDAAVRFARVLVETLHHGPSDHELEAARAAGLTDGELLEIACCVCLNFFTNFVNHINHTEIDWPIPAEH
ncbi:MAG: carboxymuconolactone decarboxylase family protein [Candidatus Sumerlaeia bacterium]|nr:carboxymuconolactone decarboxylase family protein [Candidatus Sumerlaeia bacterium]